MPSVPSRAADRETSSWRSYESIIQSLRPMSLWLESRLAVFPACHWSQTTGVKRHRTYSRSALPSSSNLVASLLFGSRRWRQCDAKLGGTLFRNFSRGFCLKPLQNCAL